MHEIGHIGFDVYFSKLPDPRISRRKLLSLKMIGQYHDTINYKWITFNNLIKCLA